MLREGPGPHLSDVDSLWLRPGEKEAGAVQEERPQAQQFHACANQSCCDHVVDEEGAIVWQEHAPGHGGEWKAAAEAEEEKERAKVLGGGRRESEEKRERSGGREWGGGRDGENVS